MESISISLEAEGYLEYGRDPKAFTHVTYMYTCGANYKHVNDVQIQGVIRPEVFAHLDSVLFDGECFLPRQLGLSALSPEPFGEGYDDEVDHSLHTVELVSWGLKKEGVKMAAVDAKAFTEKVMAVTREADWDFVNYG